ncbi:MAG TPA: hypothetical protein VNU23_00315, partial [Candidatus Cybelea sp.]|nr:hypothetical protein [Candidatus Cybelea sp.]
MNPRTGPGTRCDLGQNGHTNRVPCAFGIRSTITAQPGLHSLYRTGSGGGTTTFPVGRTGLVLFAAARLVAPFAGRADRFAAARRKEVRRPAVRVVRVALIVFALTGPLCHHRPASSVCCVTLVRFGPLLPSLNDVAVRALVVARLLAQRRE